MRKAIIVCAVGAFLLGTLLGTPSALAKGDSVKKTEVWWYEGSLGVGPLHKAVFLTTWLDIVFELRYEPDFRFLVFMPVEKFRKSKGGDYILWTFNPGQYTIAPDSPRDLSDFFTPWAQYWLKITMCK